MKTIKKLLLFIMSTLLVGCIKGEVINEYNNIQKKLTNMDSYSSKINVKYISNKGENEYNLFQQAKKNGKYKIETLSPEMVKGNIIIFDGKMVWQYNKNLNSKISIGEKDKLERKEISIFSFLENQAKSNEVAIETANTNEGIYTILEANIPGDNKYFNNEKLWVNNETKNPEKLIIYDKDGKERVIVTYEDFKYNPNLEDTLFNIENIANHK